MISSQLRMITILMLKQNSKRLLGRELKDYEIQHFMNINEDKVNIIVEKAKHKIEIMVNQYIEDQR